MRRRRGDNVVTLNVELGEIEIWQGVGWMARDVFLACGEGATVEINSPDVGDELFQATVAIDESDLNPAAVEQALRLLAFASNVAELINDANAEGITKQAQEEAEQKQREAEEREVAQARTNERVEILLNELMGDTVRVRHYGYRTTAKATVESQEYGEGGHRPWLRWHQEGNYTRRRSDVQNWKRLDVKTDKGWKTVWDDGKDDVVGARLPEVKPWTGGLR